MTILLLLLLAQDPEALVERLRSGSPAEREEAVASLKALGEKAEPALRKAAEDADFEVATAARRLLGRIGIDRALTPRLKAEFPGLVDRLTTSELAWAEAFVAAGALLRSPGGLRNADVAPLASRALRAPAPPETLAELARISSARGLREAIPGLLSLLTHEDADVVYAAVGSLESLDAQEAVPALSAMLSGPVLRARLPAMRAIKELGTRDPLPELRRVLKDPDGQVRLAALKTISRVEPPAFQAPDVAALLSDPSADIRAEAAATLADLGARRERGPLGRTLTDPSPAVREAAIRTFSLLGPEGDGADVLEAARSLPARERQRMLERLNARRWPGVERLLIEEARRGDDESVRAVAVFELRIHPGGVDTLLEFATRGKELTRGRALLGFMKQQTPSALPLLVEALVKEPVHRMGVEAVLSFWEDEEAARRVKPLVDHDDVRVRWSAIWILAKRGDASMKDRIVAGLTDRDAFARTSAVQAAAALDLEEWPDELTRRLADPDRAVRDAAEVAFRKTALRASEPVLLEQAGHEDPRVRRESLGRLWNLRSRSSVAVARRHLSDPDSKVRWHAADLAGSFGEREAIPELRARLKDPDPTVCAQVILALGNLGAKDAAAEIAAFATSKDPNVRNAAALALERMDAREYAPLVRALLRDESELLRAVGARLAGAWKTDGAENDLAEMLEDWDGEVQDSALEGLAALGATSRSAEIAALLRGPRREVAGRAAKVLGAFGARDHFGDVVGDLGRWGDSADEAELTQALERLLPAGGMETLRARLGAPDARVREGAARALAMLGKAEAWPELIRATRDPHPNVRVQALAALGPAGGEALRAAATEALEDPARPVVHQALGLLDGRGVTAADAKLRVLLADPTFKVWAVIAGGRAGAEWARQGCRDVLEDNASGDWPQQSVLGILEAGGRKEDVDVVRQWRIPSFQPDRRLLRAKSLCRMGQDDELKRVVRSGTDLHVLNALRAPGAWSELKAARWDGPLVVTAHEAVDRVAARLGWTLEADPRTLSSDLARIPKDTPLLQVLTEAQSGWILDPKVLRLLPRGATQDFWDRWAAERKKQ